MRKLLILITFVSSLILLPTTSSYADWTKVAENVTGDSYYIDFERVRKNKGLVYYWQLANYLKPTQDGTFSAKSYKEAVDHAVKSNEGPEETVEAVDKIEDGAIGPDTEEEPAPKKGFWNWIKGY